MKRVTLVTLMVATLGIVAGVAPRAGMLVQAPPWTADLAEARRVAALLPGRKPLRINVLKFAESRRTKNFSVKGAPAEPSVQARTAFQVVYADGTVMVDAGMNQQIHRFFGRGTEEPYDVEAARQVEAALDRARLIVLTHEHGDHAGGVIASPRAAALASKTILTRAQLQTLMTAPQMPEIRLTADAARRYRALDYDEYYPVAPGMAFIKAAGHTPGSQMVLVSLESGRDVLLIGDSAWHMDGVRQMVGKDAPWIVEDQPAVLDQLRWLNGLVRTAATPTIVASHDDEERRRLIDAGVLGARLE